MDTTDFEETRADLVRRLDDWRAPDDADPQEAFDLREQLSNLINGYQPGSGQSIDDAVADLRSRFQEHVDRFVHRDRGEANGDDPTPTPPDAPSEADGPRPRYEEGDNVVVRDHRGDGPDPAPPGGTSTTTGPVIRDHRGGGQDAAAPGGTTTTTQPAPPPRPPVDPSPTTGPVVRDHRAPDAATTGPVVRDHRTPDAPTTGPVIRDHRTPDGPTTAPPPQAPPPPPAATPPPPPPAPEPTPPPAEPAPPVADEPESGDRDRPTLQDIFEEVTGIDLPDLPRPGQRPPGFEPKPAPGADDDGPTTQVEPPSPGNRPKPFPRDDVTGGDRVEAEVAASEQAAPVQTAPAPEPVVGSDAVDPDLVVIDVQVEQHSTDDVLVNDPLGISAEDLLPPDDYVPDEDFTVDNRPDDGVDAG